MEMNELLEQFKTHESGAGWRAFIPTRSGNFKASIVSGYYYYSTPREDLETVGAYSAFELAIFTPDDVWASYNQIEQSGAFKIIGSYGEHEYVKEELRDAPSVNVWGWVDKDKILQLVNSI
jgi:hypothetical protein